MIDRQHSAPKLLMGRRHDGHKFMPGKYVFPGGRLERSDRLMRSASDLRPDTEARLQARLVRGTQSRGRSLALTAIRETYEETGLVVGRPADAPSAPSGTDAAWQTFADLGVLPDLSAMVFIARAITPPRRPKRFDTRFFAVDRSAVFSEADGFVGPDKELVELAWVDIQAARALDLPRITSLILEELENRLADGFPVDAPVPFYREERGKFLRDLL